MSNSNSSATAPRSHADTADNTVIEPWYKQFWPWVLIAIPVTVVIVCATIITVSTSQGSFNMVVDDYYKRGKTINVVVAKVEEARKRGIEFTIAAHDGQLRLRYVHGQPELLSALKVSFYHATQPDKDFSRLMSVAGDGTYRTDVPADLDGKYTITVEPHDGSWRVSQQFRLPLLKDTTLSPKLYGV